MTDLLSSKCSCSFAPPYKEEQETCQLSASTTEQLSLIKPSYALARTSKQVENNVRQAPVSC